MTGEREREREREREEEEQLASMGTGLYCENVKMS
jgi:hypothetical protein